MESVEIKYHFFQKAGWHEFPRLSRALQDSNGSLCLPTIDSVCVLTHKSLILGSGNQTPDTRENSFQEISMIRNHRLQCYRKGKAQFFRWVLYSIVWHSSYINTHNELSISLLHYKFTVYACHYDKMSCVTVYTVIFTLFDKRSLYADLTRWCCYH